MKSPLIVILFMNLPLAKVFADDCGMTLDALRSQNKLIIENYKKTDLTDWIEESIEQMKNCKFSPRETGMREKQLLSMLREGQRRRIAQVKKDLEQYAKMGKIDAFADEYREYAKKLGLPERAVEDYLAQQKTIAAKSYAKEKNSCKTVDMSEDFGPVRDQDSIGWCYAFAVADLASYKLKKRVSAADIALTYNKNFFFDILKFAGRTAEKFEGGWPKSALSGAIEKGLCLEKDFPSEDNAFGEISDVLAKVDTLGRRQIRAGKADCDELYSVSKALFPNVTVTDLQKILETSSRQDFMDHMSEGSCKNRIKTNMKVESLSSRSKETLASTIDEQMSAKNPIVLTYDPSGLHNRRSYPEKMSSHASVLVGRRFNEKSGQCEYLLRNSWGRGCRYDESYECNQGNIWIPKVDIIERGTDATFIK